MKKDLAASLLAVVGGAVALMAPNTSAAANVGYYLGSNFCASPASSIIAAGHTPVQVTSLDAATLAPLRALIIATCSTYQGNANVNTAVANGMALVIDSDLYSNTTHPYLPGAPTFISSFSCPWNTDLAAGSPITSGPGGTLTNAILDLGPTGGYCAITGGVTPAQLPAGFVPFLLEPSTNRVGAFGYRHGRGSVAFSMSSFSRSGDITDSSWYPGSRIYFSNALTWAIQTSFTSCEAEGITGGKLTLCRQVCEVPQSPARLSALIKTYIAAYREDPPCAK